MRVKIDKKTNLNESDIIHRAILLGTKDIFFRLSGPNVDLPSTMVKIYSVMDRESEYGVWLLDFPYCIVNEMSRDHIITRNPGAGEKNDRCRECRYFKSCAGFPAGYFKKFGTGELAPIKDQPLEVMIEVEPRCNYDCPFCYNRNSFARKNRDINALSADYVKKIIDKIVETGIGIIRFTGGEPLLRPDIFALMEYAKDKKLEVRLNTNCSLVNAANINKFKGIVDNILIPIESCSEAEEAKATGQKEALKKKVAAIRLFKKIGVPTIRVGTVATFGAINNLEKLSDFILGLPVDEWELYRPISSGRNKRKLSGIEIKKLIYGIIKIQKKTEKKIILANALPFCALNDLNKASSVSHGALFDDGHNRIVVDPRGFVKPHYFLDKNIGDPLDIISAWNSAFMKKMRNLEFLPPECRKCNYCFKCRGGSRFEAFSAVGKWDAPDPLADFNNILLWKESI
ncbi:hypothetical protein A2303_05295 [Candidatus Falkowbacteria bacterium RIFOXYB2_FULL_47_14]|uniref:Radical SAM core domain-containing protein n=1 Tax=Candidatus Falkowbacteria bacterium RIFOXYA2_FULL_47_19 TaxID=1797994 RepID=A0A1F5SEH9_9BACT|nr:MAG: hypothetical protein A2227_08005 [Candidatus Falkowbacteria bacterium RIFOXYA2_FULL_47_19]OGF34366.1 MAG: hypothetical protein A2468_04990 [Candidatus Falkowbacteria bacterium RIFOXYC2_FULL_46_15]OGF43265.1 MAG: hypothetical protein A2303_05295 [Candidatus Falkowbacteria bacterium RIFOXYB2_FULL_47_14]